MGVEDCRIIELPKISDPRGNLTFVEANRHIPFAISRVYYLYDVPGGESRAGHAHKTNHAFIISASGSFQVTVRDGWKERQFVLSRSYYGLYLPPMLWRELDNFSSGSVSLVLASDPFDEQDYYRDYRDFLRAVSAPT